MIQSAKVKLQYIEDLHQSGLDTVFHLVLLETFYIVVFLSL